MTHDSLYYIDKADIQAAKEVDILDYLGKSGFSFKQKGNIFWCSSPFSSDSDPSFAVYPAKNRFKDYSSGAYGDTIELARELHNLTFPQAVREVLNQTQVKWEKKKYKVFTYKQKQFKLENYITKDKSEVERITKYAVSRGIKEKYELGVYFKEVEGEWVRVPSLLFPHQNENGEIIGAKFRNINVTDKERFSARGKLGFYILDNNVKNTFNPKTLYLVESETSANSLYMYFKEIKHNAMVISYGGVGAVPKSLPFDLPLKIIIDFDGKELLYLERLERYKHLGGTPIKMILPKGEDLNSLWAKGKINIVANLIFN